MPEIERKFLVEAYLVERGVDLSGEQATKTKKALEHFSKRLADTTS